MTYKERARAYFTAVNNYDVAAIERMVEENYIQHNPYVPTGRAAFIALIPKLQKHGSKIKNIRILEDDQHVIMHHQWENAQPFGHDKMVAFHIIRFDSNFLIAEHWNVTREESSGVSLTEGPTKIEDREMTDSNKEKISDLFQGLIQGKVKLPSAVSGLQNIGYRKQHRVFGEGNFTLSISEGTSHGVSSAIYDLFRFEGDRLANHWRIAQEIPNKNLANANTMFGFRS